MGIIQDMNRQVKNIKKSVGIDREDRRKERAEDVELVSSRMKFLKTSNLGNYLIFLN